MTNPLPYFIPEDLDLGKMPIAFREAIDDIILPAYQELVVEAATALERAAGTTLCFDMWLELLEQYDLVGTVTRRVPTPPRGCKLVIKQVPDEPDDESILPPYLPLKRYQILGARKEKLARFLLQFRMARARWGAPIDGPSAVWSGVRPAVQPVAQPAREAATDSTSGEKARQPVIDETAGDAGSESGATWGGGRGELHIGKHGIC